VCRGDPLYRLVLGVVSLSPTSEGHLSFVVNKSSIFAKEDSIVNTTNNGYPIAIIRLPYPVAKTGASMNFALIFMLFIGLKILKIIMLLQ
jgi:hypothetical protein